MIYSYGGFTAETSFVRSDEKGTAPIHITREGAIPNSKLEALMKDPFANVEEARTAPLRIQKAVLGQVPQQVMDGWWRWGSTCLWRSTRWAQGYACGWRFQS